MNCAVIFFGETVTTAQKHLLEMIQDLKLQPNHTLRAENEAQLAAQIKEAQNLATIIIIIGGLDPLKNQSAKTAICVTYQLSLVRSLKLYGNLEKLCTGNGIDITKRLEQIAMIPEGMSPVLFEGITYGLSGVLKDNLILVLPDELKAESYTAVKSILVNTIVNQKRILSKHQMVQQQIVPEKSKAPPAVERRSAYQSKQKFNKKSTQDPLGRFLILLGIVGMILLLLFGIYLLGDGRENPLFTLTQFSSQPQDTPSSSEEQESGITLSIPPLESSQEDDPSSATQSTPPTSSKPSSSEEPSSAIISSETPSSQPPISQAPPISSATEIPPPSSIPISASSSIVLTPEKPSPSKVESQAPSHSEPPEEDPEEEPTQQPSGDLAPPEGDSYHDQTLKVNISGSVESYNAYELIGLILENETRGGLHPEALKAHAVASYSYVKHANQQGTAPVVALREPVSDAVWDAIDAVDGYGVFYNGKIANTVYHSTSAGYTLDAKDVWGGSVDYLKAVSSPLDKKSSYYEGKYTISEDDMFDKIQDVMGITPSGDPEDWFEILDTKSGGYVMSIDVCGKKVTGRYLRETLLRFSLRSTSFTIRWNGDAFIFTTAGYGHGVGLSQHGAHYMAQDKNKTFDEILTHYFTGVEVL